MKVNRNDPCPCGSGRKFKNCHDGRSEIRSKRTAAIVAVLVMAGMALVGLKLISGEGQSEAPPGKVWSDEHGHFH